MKIITLNLNGIRSASRKGFYDWLPRQKADFVCLQELKAHEIDLDDQMKFLLLKKFTKSTIFL